MSLTSFAFFEFLLVFLLLFYFIRPAQKYVLLLASIYFYVSISSDSRMKLCALIMYVGLITYIGAIFIEKTHGIWKKTIFAVILLCLILSLFFLKYAYNVFSVFFALVKRPMEISWLKFGAVVGLSYYSLSAIGYLIDVFWGNQKAVKNPIDVFLFVFFFPQLISGPLTRFNQIHPQICEKKSFDVNRFLFGIRRMAWGYFKKLVISERFAIVVSIVWGGEYTKYSLLGMVGATICYAVQLYTDFSGCMDIIMGASILFGIELPENFNAPFFAESIQEFWQRWHITLGTWFKDYVMYPLQKSYGIQAIGKWSKKKFGKKIGKKIPFYISMLVLWTLIGLWHGGTGYYFIASACIPCILLILSDILQPLFKKLVDVLHINTECQSWKWFRRIRTLLLICICWMVVCSGGTHNFVSFIRYSMTNLWNYTAFNSAVEITGLTFIDILLMVIGVFLLYITDTLSYRGDNIFRFMNKQNYIFRVLLVYLEIITILLHGMVGKSSFIYFQF